MVKINYDLLFLETLDKVKSLKEKPTLLLHFCCGVCLSYPLDYLSNFFDLTVIVDFSNIYPKEEYEKRRDSAIRLVETYSNVKYVEFPYKASYQSALEIFNDGRECGTRCHFCYFTRMNEAYKYAADNHFDYFTTVMSISRQKRSETFNEIGLSLNLKYPNTKYLCSDFKKNNGINKSNEIVEKLKLYRQSYCGCQFSTNNFLPENK